MSGFGRQGSVVTRIPMTFVGPGDFTFGNSNVVVVNKTIGSATTVFLPADPTPNCEYVVADGKGDASLNIITIDGNGRLINGAATASISTASGSLTLFYNGVSFFVIGSNP